MKIKDIFKEAGGFWQGVEKGLRDPLIGGGKTTSTASSGKTSTTSSPFDRYRKEDLRVMFDKILKKEELGPQEIKIAKELYREFNKF
jgi:hypothetical protein